MVSPGCNHIHLGTHLVGDSFLQQQLIQFDSAAGPLQSPLAFLITHPITITFDVC